MDPAELNDESLEMYLAQWLVDSLDISMPLIGPVLLREGVTVAREFNRDAALDLAAHPERAQETASRLLAAASQWGHYFPYLSDIDGPVIEYNALAFNEFLTDMEDGPALLLALKQLGLVSHYGHSTYGPQFLTFTLSSALLHRVRTAWNELQTHPDAQTDLMKFKNMRQSHQARLRSYLDSLAPTESSDLGDLYSRYAQACRATGLDMVQVIQAELSLLKASTGAQPLTVTATLRT